jgi:hypothetical protein
MSAGDTSETKATEQIPATAERREMAVRRDGALISGAGAVAALALGAVAVGALAIGKMAIGHLALGRTRVRSGQVDELRIACLTSESWMARVRFQCPECGFGDHEVGRRLHRLPRGGGTPDPRRMRGRRGGGSGPLAGTFARRLSRSLIINSRLAAFDRLDTSLRPRDAPAGGRHRSHRRLGRA